MTTPAAMSHQSFRGNSPCASTGLREPLVGWTGGGLTSGGLAGGGSTGGGPTGGGLAGVAGLDWASAELYGRRVIVAAARGVTKRHRVAAEAFG